MDLIPENLKEMALKQLERYELIRKEMRAKKVIRLTQNQVDTLMKKANVELPKLKAKYREDMTQARKEQKANVDWARAEERKKADDMMKAVNDKFIQKIDKLKDDYNKKIEYLKKDKAINVDYAIAAERAKMAKAISELTKKHEAELFSLKDKLDKRIYLEKIRGYRNLEAYKKRVERQRQQAEYEKLFKEEAARQKKAEQDELAKQKKFLKSVMKNLKYMRAEYQEKVKAILDDIQLAKPTAATLDRIQKMKDFFDRPENADLIIPKSVRKALDRLGQTPWKDLEHDERLRILTAVQAYVAQNNLKNQLILNGRRKAQKDMLDEAMENIKKRPLLKNAKIEDNFIDLKSTPDKRGLAKNFKMALTIDSYDPEYITQLLDNQVGSVLDDTNGIITKILHHDLNKGSNEALKYYYNSMDELKKFIKDEKINIMGWSEKFNTKGKKVQYVKINLPDMTDENGKVIKDRSIEMTKEQRAEIYLHTFNPDNLASLLDGGVSITGRRQNTYPLTPEDLKAITDSMTDEEKKVANKILELFNRENKGDIKEGLNRVSTLLNGYPVAMVENYYPKNTNEFFRHKDPGKTQNDFVRQTVEGQGHLKERSGGRTSIFINGIFQTFAESIQLSSSYIGLANPLRNAKTLLENEGFRREIYNRYGEDYYKALKNMLQDIEGNSIDISNIEKVTGELLTNVQGAILSANLFVPLKQPTAYINAITELDGKYLLKGLLKRPNWKEISEHSPVLRNRAEGNSDREMGEFGQIGRLRNEFTGKTSLQSKGTYLIKFFDLFEIGRIWEAVKAEVKDLRPDLSGDAYWNMVAERTEEVVNRHQPSTFMQNRSQIARSQNVGVRLATTFTSQANKVMNQVNREFLRYKTSKKTVKDKAKLVKNLTSLLVIASMLIQGVDMFRDMMLGRRRKKLNEFIAGTAANIMGNVYYVGPFINALESKWEKGTLSGNEIQNPVSSFGGEVIEALYNSGKAIDDIFNQNKYASGENKGETKWEDSVKKAAEDLFLTALKLKGIPAKNLENDANLILNRIPGTAAYNYKLNNGTLDAAAEYKAQLKKIEEQLADKKTPAGRKIYLESQKKILTAKIRKVYTENKVDIPSTYKTTDEKKRDALKKEMQKKYGE
jgi:hypothetical protein